MEQPLAAAKGEEAGLDNTAAALARQLGPACLSALQAFGGALVDQLPVRCACNNFPGCDSLAGVSEEAAGLKSCSACGAVRYCGKACSAAHWQRHRSVCRALQKQQQVGMGSNGRSAVANGVAAADD